MRTVALLALCFFVGSCAPVDTKMELVSSLPNGPVSTHPGATILDFQLSKALPNAFGNADLFGRRTDAGRIVVHYIGVKDGAAVFAREDTLIHSNATTMSETPLFLPSTSTSSVNGMVGNTPFSASGQSTSYNFIPARGSQQIVAQGQPLYLFAEPGQSIVVEDKTITVISIENEKITYQVR